MQLTVSDTEQERRINAPSRREFHKLTDAAALRRSSSADGIEQPPTDIRIDTDQSAPSETAARIVECFDLPVRLPSPRYPPLDAAH